MIRQLWRSVPLAVVCLAAGLGLAVRRANRDISAVLGSPPATTTCSRPWFDGGPAGRGLAEGL
jgi:hypothetical protein